MASEVDVDAGGGLPTEHTRDFPPGGGRHLDLNLLMEAHRSKCNSVFLTTVLSSRHDPVRGGYIQADFAYFERYYRSIMTLPGGIQLSVHVVCAHACSRARAVRS